MTLQHIYRTAFDDPLTGMGTIILGLLIFVGLLGPYLPLGDPEAIGVGPRLAPPSWNWPLGTDELGRSILPRAVEAIGTTFVLAIFSVIGTAIIGTIAGMAAGYSGGLLDMIVMRLADVLFSFPGLLLAILLVAVIGPGKVSAMIAIVLITLPLFIRVIRAVTLTVAEKDFLITAKISGASYLRILSVHILPNITGALIIQLSYAMSVAILIESALSFLGLGVQPPEASLGSLLRLGTRFIGIAPWLAFAPGLLVIGAILSINLIGDGLRDRLDPLKGKNLQ